MKKQSIKKISLLFAFAMIVMVCLMPMAAFAEDAEAAEVSNYFGTYWSLLAPVIAIVLALITKEVYSSLFIGILAGALLSANFKPVAAMDNLLNEGIIAAVAGTAGIFIFLVVLGILVALINKAGGSAAFGAWASKNIKSKVGASL
ncbi:MAG: Na+/H+ antiporter NhaC family protein, partial [Clostridia bacterium]|nr:Na+/H+ antiporter NhaC family protein [Clostridia bacterium]